MLKRALEDITDINELRAVIRAEIGRRDAALAVAEAEIVAAKALVAASKAEIAARDALLANKDSELSKKDSQLAKREQLIELLKEANRKLNQAKYGRQSERLGADQLALFEAAIDEDIAANESAIEALTPTKREKKPRSGKQPKRQPLPAHLPRVEVRLEPESCNCADCGGVLHQIGEEVAEKLDVKPAVFSVRRIIRPKMACRACETIHTAPALPSIIDRGIPTPNLMAYVTVLKYLDHLPLYRLHEIFLRSGVQISISTLCAWVGAIGYALQPLIEALRNELRGDKVLHADETPVQMLQPGSGKTHKAYLFAYRRGEIEEPPIIVYDFADSRSGKHARAFLEGYRGALAVDDYSGYKAMFKPGEIRQIACWAHARRKFFELHRANKSELAVEALARIGAIYAVEASAREKRFDAPARHALRKTVSRPLVESLFTWLKELRPKVNNGSAAAKAVDYLLRNEPAFTAYLDDGCFPIDNNPVENAIRPIALGRKNWLFAGSLQAGQRAANIMSLVHSAKANGHDPMAYLADILERIPATPHEQLTGLLPHVWKPSQD